MKLQSCEAQNFCNLYFDIAQVMVSRNLVVSVSAHSSLPKVFIFTKE